MIQFLETASLPKQLEQSSHSLAYEITRLINTGNPIYRGLSPSEMVSVSLNKPASYRPFSLSLNRFSNETSGT